MVSNDVLEWEIERLTKQIAQLKVTKKPIPEDLADRLQQANLKMQILVVQVRFTSPFLKLIVTGTNRTAISGKICRASTCSNFARARCSKEAGIGRQERAG